jgi:putative transferase (TIGR04331 family)
VEQENQKRPAFDLGEFLMSSINADKAANPQYLIFGTMPEDASPRTHIAAGEWCFLNREDIFPDWENTFAIARSHVPADGAEAIAEMRKATAWSMAKLHRYADEKTRTGMEAMQPYVWELLFGKWAITAGLSLAYAYHMLRRLIEDYGQLPLQVPVAAASPKRTWPDATHLYYDTGQAEGMFWLLSRLMEHMAPPAWRLESVAQEPASPPAHLSENQNSGFVTELYRNVILWLRAKRGKIPASDVKGMRGILRTFLKRLFIPPTSLLPIPQFPFTSQWQRLCVSAALIFAGEKSSNARTMRDIYPGTGEEFPHFFDDIFWSMLPRTLEGVETKVKARSGLLRAYIVDSAFLSDSGSVVRYAGRVRAGARLVTAQHAPSYAFVHPDLPYRAEEGRHHHFCTWGDQVAITSHPVKTPPFAYMKIANSHKERVPTLYYVMAGLCPVVTASSLGVRQSVRQYRNDSIMFIESLTEDIRKNLVLRPYPGVVACFDGTSWAARRYPDIPLHVGEFTKAVKKCRITAVDYSFGSAFGQPLMINSPLVWFFRRESYPFSQQGLELCERFRQAGILHDSPEQAAAFIAAIWDDVSGWWNSEPVQSARLAYLRADADITIAHPLKTWIRAAYSM